MSGKSAASVGLILARACGLIVAGVALGLVVHQVRPAGFSMTAYEPPTACVAESAGIEPVETLSPEAVVGLCGDPGVIIADVRSADRYAEGHVADAIHLPCTASSEAADKAVSLLQLHDTLIVYDDGDGLAGRVAESLRKQVDREGLRIIAVSGGFPAWNAAGLACMSGPCGDCGEARL